MRPGLKALVVAATLGSAAVFAAPSAGAQESGGVNDGAGASNTRDGARIGAETQDSANPTGPEATGSNGTSVYECSWYYGPPGSEAEVSEGELQSIFDELGRTEGETIDVRIRCVNTTNGNVAEETVEWPGAAPEDVVDPFVLAQEARDSIRLPAPHAQTSPPIEAGSYAQLPTYFSVGNAGGVLTGDATVPGVDVQVTATAVEQYWTIYESGPGSAALAELGPCPATSTESCSWTPANSSSGQPAGNPWTEDEPCFYAEVSVMWDMSWTVNGSAGDPALDPGWVSGSICLPVAEVQAVVNHG